MWTVNVQLAPTALIRCFLTGYVMQTCPSDFFEVHLMSTSTSTVVAYNLGLGMYLCCTWCWCRWHQRLGEQHLRRCDPKKTLFLWMPLPMARLTTLTLCTPLSILITDGAGFIGSWEHVVKKLLLLLVMDCIHELKYMWQIWRKHFR